MNSRPNVTATADTVVLSLGSAGLPGNKPIFTVSRHGIMKHADCYGASAAILAGAGLQHYDKNSGVPRIGGERSTQGGSLLTDSCAANTVCSISTTLLLACIVKLAMSMMDIERRYGENLLLLENPC